mmetsp:Transcript_1897/g.5615  ORF Transcript_1897/g.5615 Transcript_1897/m.5615 type:complete len:230 (+) Transcript_1897:33-722(+)
MMGKGNECAVSILPSPVRNTSRPRRMRVMPSSASRRHRRGCFACERCGSARAGVRRPACNESDPRPACAEGQRRAPLELCRAGGAPPQPTPPQSRDPRWLSSLPLQQGSSRCRSSAQSSYTAVTPLEPLKRKVLLSGTYCRVTALMASCAATPPSTDAMLCVSAPPQRQYSATQSSETGHGRSPLSPSLLSCSATHKRSAGMSDSTSASAKPGAWPRCAAKACDARSKM